MGAAFSSKNHNKTSPEAVRDRILGCLYGQAVGDALGCRYEFQDVTETTKMIAQDKGSDGFLPILGGGPFNNEPGEVTDDTELAMGLARSMIRMGTYDPDDVAYSYYQWYLTDPWTIGRTTICALDGAGDTDKAKVRQNILNNSSKKCTRSWSNGCMMRISPLAIAGINWKVETLQKVANLDTQLTNPNERTLQAVAAYVTAVRTAILTGDAEESFRAAESCVEQQTLKDMFTLAKVQPIPVKLDDPDAWLNGDTVGMGYIGVALQGAMYHLIHSHNFHHALRDTVARGGDTDTNGCITGALMGALLGAEAIPEQWKTAVVSGKFKRSHAYPAVDLSDLEQVAVELAKSKEPDL